MADTGMAEVLKTFAAKITVSKLTERRRILGDLATCVAKPEFPEPAIKGVLKHLLMTLGCYNDRKSRLAVNGVIEALVVHQFDKLIKHFNTIIGKVGEQQKTAVPSVLNSGIALTVLDWTCILMRLGYKSADKMEGDHFIKMVELQSYLLYGSVGALRNNITKNAMAKMRRVWLEIKGSLEKYYDGLAKMDQNIYTLCLPSFIVQYLHGAKRQEELKKYMSTFIEQYVKLVIGNRTKPETHLLENLKHLLQQVSHEMFKETIQPAIDKAMLRNPEITLGAVTYMLSGVTLDLSSYALDLGKHLATQLHSKEDATRDIAANGCLNLARQCSDPTAVEKLIKLLFAVLNGSEGKMTVASQRMGMLTGIGNLSYNTVSRANSTQILSGTVAELFIPVLQQEVHEGTLIHALSMFTLWCEKFCTEVPSKVTQWFKTGFGQKTSTSAVRNAYIKCMNAAFHGDTLVQGIDVLPLLVQTVEKANNQATQVQLVTEGLSAACLLLKLSTCDIQAEAKLGSFWNIILDREKQLFTNDKFLFSVSDDALQHVAFMVEKLVMDPQRMDGEVASQYYKAFVHALTHGTYQHRKRVKYSAKKLLSALGGSKIAIQLLKKFHELLETQKVIDTGNDMLENGEMGGELSKMIAPHILVDSLLTLSNLPNAETQEAEIIIMETLFDAHHPCIVHYNNSAWTDIVARFKVDAVEFIQGHMADIISDIKNCHTVTETVANTIVTFARLVPDAILPEIVNYSCSCVDNPALLTVTHMDYAIMNTPEGELWDKSVLEKGGKGNDKMTNIRRENKLYSYEDQLAEIELRKELEKRKKAKGINVEPKLTKQQLEAKQAQLEKEAAIRNQTKEMDNQVKNACSLIVSCVQGNPGALRFFIPLLLQTIIPLLSSPLTAPRVSQLFVDLKESAFYEVDRIHRFFALMIAHVTLRQCKPQCGLNSEWTSEPAKTQVKRAISQLFEATVTPKTSSQSILSTKDDKAFPAPTFAYCFHLLKGVLKDGGHCVGREDKVLIQALEIISSHAKMRSEEGKEDKDMNSPHFLPRKEMFDLLVRVIGTSTGKVQQLAQDALLQLGMSSSGMGGCAAAEQDEIDVLLQALQSPTTAVRESALQGLLAMVLVLPALDSDYENAVKLVQRTWVAKYDVEDVNKHLAEGLWEEAGLELEADLCTRLVVDTTHNEEVIRQAGAVGLANALAENPDYVPAVLQQLMEVYEEKLYTPPPVLDSFGRVMSEAPPDEWPARSGIALAICKMSPYISEDQVEALFEFFVQKSLGDRSSEVRKHMLDAAVAVVNDHGKDNVNTLLPVFEDFLVQAPDTASFDAVRQSVVILMGSLAKHLDKDDPKVKPIVAKLIETLSTPSQQVQEAVANCLPPLVPAIKADAPELVQKLLQLLLESENYGERKGAAYGLAGLVKGLGILALKQLDIMTALTDAIQNKKNPRYREGALFAFEMLCLMLGRLFEPYIVHILPHLLLCFGDNNPHVREAADDCAKAVMSKLSAHGVKLVLPSLLTAIEEDSWRTKTGSVELLGAMAFCAPKQLSACLPSIVPKLTEVLTDSHLKVQKAGEQALKQIGSVIKNPEIQAIVPTLLDALQDPTRKTTVSLQCLLETKFVHFIDAPSLALIMPVVQRAFQDRSTETRKMAAQIIGNMYSLTDQKDLSPYLPSVIPGLKASLLDPVPEVRSVSARALGAIVKGMGESGCEDLLPWLMQTLTSEYSSVDRSGAAQGLSEVVGGLGLDKLKELMPDIISTSERTHIHPHVRDGYIMMYIYLPSVFPEEFLQYVGPIIPSVLKALADESEYVRDTALRAGQRIITMYADTAIELLLPELEKGLFDDNWRIRYSSVQLLGDLLYKISGVTGKMSTESAGEDDNFGTETSQKAIMRCLGGERRNRVLAGLYMGRSDTALMVRQSALHVWKVIVTHTPKTLREILSTLFQLLLGCLASSSYDKRQVAARTLGDVVRKLGEKVLPEIIPILEKGLESDRSDQRQGVCIGLSEIMISTGKDHVIVFADSLIPTVRKALCDPLPEVREAAAKTFDNLHSNIGTRALDDILPDMLNKLDNEELSEFALDGLKQVMAVKSRVVLPYLVPQLTTPPINTRALSFLSSVAGEALTKHLNRILQALMSSLSEKQGTPDEEQELQYCQTVVLSVVDDLGVRVVMDELLTATSQSDVSMRWAAVTILHSYCQHTKADYSDFVPKLFTAVLCMFTDTNERVLNASWDCLNAITKKLDASDMLGHISNLRTSLRYAMSDYKGDELPGFCLPKKGITPILPIFREGILNGPPELKESAAKGLGDVIKKTSAEALKPSVVNITGPLIRILGDRFSFNVKVAVLETLGLLLGKCGAMLKPFLPQLQTTFVKALNDPNRSVRLKAASALGKLIVIHTRVDPLFTELHTGVKADNETAVKDTMLQALRNCIVGAGAKMSDAVRKQITATLEGLLSSTDDTTRTTAAACLGALCSCLKEDELAVVLHMHLLDTDASLDWVIRHGRAVALSIAMKEAFDKIVTEEYSSKVYQAALAFTTADRIPLSLAGIRSVGFLLRYQLLGGIPLEMSLFNALAKCMKHESNDIKALTAQIVSFLAKSVKTPLDLSVQRIMVPVLVNGTKEKNTLVKTNSELALVALLRLRKGDQTLQACLTALDSGMRESLKEVVSKVLRKVATQPDNADDDIDDTILV